MVPARTFVIHFDGDVAASAVEHLRIEVTAVLTMAQPQDEVVVCIESSGGMVQQLRFGCFANDAYTFRRFL